METEMGPTNCAIVNQATCINCELSMVLSCEERPCGTKRMWIFRCHGCKAVAKAQFLEDVTTEKDLDHEYLKSRGLWKGYAG